MRVVGGEFRGRSLAGPAGATRPTSDRVRETIFDILAHRYGDPASGELVLDLFAGTGALGIEALSRGAVSCLMVEQSADARATIRRNIEALNLTGRARIYRRDATKLGEVGNLGPFGLFFADPPYGRGLGEAALDSAATGGWLVPGAIGVLEEAANAAVSLPPGFADLDQRAVGETRLLFLRWEGSK